MPTLSNSEQRLGPHKIATLHRRGVKISTGALKQQRYIKDNIWKILTPKLFHTVRRANDAGILEAIENRRNFNTATQRIHETT